MTPYLQCLDAIQSTVCKCHKFMPGVCTEWALPQLMGSGWKNSCKYPYLLIKDLHSNLLLKYHVESQIFTAINWEINFLQGFSLFPSKYTSRHAQLPRLIQVFEVCLYATYVNKGKLKEICISNDGCNSDCSVKVKNRGLGL